MKPLSHSQVSLNKIPFAKTLVKATSSPLSNENPSCKFTWILLNQKRFSKVNLFFEKKNYKHFICKHLVCHWNGSVLNLKTMHICLALSHMKLQQGMEESGNKHEDETILTSSWTHPWVETLAEHLQLWKNWCKQFNLPFVNEKERRKQP